MKKFLVILMIVALLFVSGCNSNKEENNKKEEETIKTVEGLTEENKYIYDFITDNVVSDFDNGSYKRYFIFGKDGKFLYNFNTNITFENQENILMVRGTWKFEGKQIIMERTEGVSQIPKEDKSGYYLETHKRSDTRTNTMREIVDRDGKQYIKGTSYLYKRNDYSEELKKELYKYLEEGLDIVDLDRLKELESK